MAKPLKKKLRSARRNGQRHCGQDGVPCQVVRCPKTDTLDFVFNIDELKVRIYLCRDHAYKPEKK